jgi:hypothetical protein
LRDNIVVEALPGDLPHDITLDISSIETLNDSLFIKDLVVSEKVIIKEEMDMPIVVAVAISEEKEETVATEETATTDKPTTEESTKSK